MSFEQITPQAEINAYIDNSIDRITKATIYTLSYVGERCRNEQIQKHKYKNQTGNLEASTGYVVLVNGKVANIGGFQPREETGKEGMEGAKKAKDFAKNIARQLSAGMEGYVSLVVVAGMSYARYVSDKGLDVLDSAALLADKLVPKMLEKLDYYV